MTENDRTASPEAGPTDDSPVVHGWRPTWPIGRPDDFVADLTDGGWVRLRRLAAATGPAAWEWTIGGRHVSDTGRADTHEAAEAAVRQRLAAAPSI